MKIKVFIKKAIEGGWRKINESNPALYTIHEVGINFDTYEIMIE